MLGCGRVARVFPVGMKLPLRILWCGALLAWFGGSLSAAPLAHPAAREALSLNGRWNIIVDPYDNGYFNYRLEPFDASVGPNGLARGGYFLDKKPATPAELIEYDFDRSPSLNVPGDWNSQDDKLLYYEGTLWYRRLFDFTPAPGKRQFIHFGGANYETHIYLNGAKLGTHVGGFTPFEFEVTGKLRPTGNSLVVRVNNQRHPEGVPTVNTDWWNYGGLTRDVRLLETPATAIRDYVLRLDAGAERKVRGQVQLDGAKGAQAVKVEIAELKVTATGTTDANGLATLEFSVPSAELWSPEHPRLYEIVITSGEDRLTDKVGFRTIQTRGADILLNGQSVFLRGICLHEENPLRGGRATTAEEARQLLGWAKELGCNYVRLAHYPHNEAVARVADEMGMLLWEEVPVYWTIHWSDPATYANAENQLTELIMRDRNRASVIIWSMANETPASAPRTDFLTRLATHARSLDATRLISAAMEVHADPADFNTKIVEDPLAKVTDITSFNQYIGWYVGTPDDCAKVKWVVPSDKPVLISEFGADALQGHHGERTARFTEEFQADLYRKTLPMLEKIPQLRGLTPWILCDFRSPRRVLPQVQDGWNRKGLIGENGVRKQAFYILQDFYKSKTAAP